MTQPDHAAPGSDDEAASQFRQVSEFAESGPAADYDHMSAEARQDDGVGTNYLMLFGE